MTSRETMAKPPSRLRVNASAVAPRLAIFAVVVVLVTGLVVGMIG